MTKRKIIQVMIISDGTGETASSVARAAMSQFKDQDVFYTRYKNVRTIQKVETLFHEAAHSSDIILYTLAAKELRTKISELAAINNVKAIDILGPVLNNFSEIFQVEKDFKPGLLHHVDDDYFSKVEAIEFTLANDNTLNLESLEHADIILVGVSRTSKTPLSVYLSLKGLKTINIPIHLNQELPSELFNVNQMNIYALTTDTKILKEVRSGLLKKENVVKKETDFADEKHMQDEIDWGQKIFDQNPRWPVFDVSNITLEEVAAEILKIYYMRADNKFKQDQRFK